MAKRLAERVCRRLLLLVGRRCKRAGLPGRRERERQWHDEKHDGGEDDERLLPADAVNERHRERREQELPERAGRRPRAEGDRAPVRRHQLAEGADHDGEGGAGEPESDHRTGREMKHARRGRVGHGRQTERIEDRPQAEDRRGSIMVCHRPGHGLGRAPQQHLDGEREREHVAAPPMCTRHRGEKKS